MKVKFIEENPDWLNIGIRNEDNCLILNEIYNAEYNPDGYFGGTDYTDSYQINDFEYPVEWFQIIEEK